MLNCVNVDGTYYVDGDGPVCFTGQHSAIVLISIYCLILFLPSTVYLSLFFLDAGEGAIGFISQYLLYGQLGQLILTEVGVYVGSGQQGNAESFVILFTALFVNLAFAIIYVYLCPCQHQVRICGVCFFFFFF